MPPRITSISERGYRLAGRDARRVRPPFLDIFPAKNSSDKGRTHRASVPANHNITLNFIYQQISLITLFFSRGHIIDMYGRTARASVVKWRLSMNYGRTSRASLLVEWKHAAGFLFNQLILINHTDNFLTQTPQIYAELCRVISLSL